MAHKRYWKEDLEEPEVLENDCPFCVANFDSLKEPDRDKHLDKCRAEYIRKHEINTPNQPIEKKVCRLNHSHIIMAVEFNFHELYSCPNMNDYDMLPADLGWELKHEAKKRRKEERKGGKPGSTPTMDPCDIVFKNYTKRIAKRNKKYGCQQYIHEMKMNQTSDKRRLEFVCEGEEEAKCQQQQCSCSAVCSAMKKIKLDTTL